VQAARRIGDSIALRAGSSDMHWRVAARYVESRLCDVIDVEFNMSQNIVAGEVRNCGI
jgi:hypothetical protein